MAQFKGRDVYFTRYKNVRSEEQIDSILTEAAIHHDLVIHTIVSPDLRKRKKKKKKEKRKHCFLIFFDIFFIFFDCRTHPIRLRA